MNVRLTRDVIVVGGGPAGLAAAFEARRAGLEVTVIDERADIGGQIYKQPLPGMLAGSRRDRTGRAGTALLAEASASGAELLTQTAVWGIWGRQVAFCREPDQAGLFAARQVVLATGAYDRPVVFPGWTLPGVMTAGGLHSLMKTQQITPGRTILVAGTGPLLLMFAAQLLRHGAAIREVLDVAPRLGPRRVLDLARAARGNVDILSDGLGYLATIARHRVPLRRAHVIVRAEGPGQVETATIARVDRSWRPVPGTERVVEVDTVALGYGLVPSVELALLAGCVTRYDEDLGGHVPVRDEWMRTSAAGVLAAGDGAGVAGADAAVAEGRIAGIAAALDCGRITPAEADRRAAPARSRLRQLDRLHHAISRTFEFQDGIYQLATPDTVVCRCEEVSAATILGADHHGDLNVLKALTRVGMGLCQGRQCSRQAAALLAGPTPGDPPLVTPRTPVRPVRIGAIAEERVDEAPADITGG